MDTLENTIAIFNYRQFKNILEKKGQTFSTKAKAFASGKLIYDGQIEYSISCDNGRDWSEISILWNMPEITSKALGLYMGYSTAYQSFSFENNSLTITDQGNEIKIILY